MRNVAQGESLTVVGHHTWSGSKREPTILLSPGDTITTISRSREDNPWVHFYVKGRHLAMLKRDTVPFYGTEQQLGYW